MKKQLLAAVTASIVISSAGAVFAADETSQQIKFDGSLSVHYRDQLDTHSGNPDRTRTAWKTTLTLNANAPLAANLDAYATFNYQNINTNAPGVGFVADYLHSNDKNNSGITAIGLKYKNDGYSYVVGSQLMTLGGGIIYDNGYIGRNAAPYALNISKKVGVTDLNVIVAKTNYQNGLENDKFYTIQGSYDVTPQTNLGAMFTHVSYGNATRTEIGLVDSGVDFYSVYGSQKLSDRTTISSEYARSNSAVNNQAFQTNLSYKLDGKNSFGIGYFHVEDQACILDYNGYGMTTNPNNNAEGYTVSWKHKFDKNFSMKIGNFHYKAITGTPVTSGGAGTDRSRFFTNATVSF